MCCKFEVHSRTLSLYRKRVSDGKLNKKTKAETEVTCALCSLEAMCVVLLGEYVF